MIDIKPYEDGDVYKIVDLKGYYDSDPKGKERFNDSRLCDRVHLRSIYLDDQLIAVVGLNVLWPGVADVFSMMGNRVHDRPVSFARSIIRLLVEYQKTLSINRIQGQCLCGYSKLEKWFETIGFKKESILRKYGPGGEDYYMYARII